MSRHGVNLVGPLHLGVVVGLRVNAAVRSVFATNVAHDDHLADADALGSSVLPNRRLHGAEQLQLEHRRANDRTDRFLGNFSARL